MHSDFRNQPRRRFDLLRVEIEAIYPARHLHFAQHPALGAAFRVDVNPWQQGPKVVDRVPQVRRAGYDLYPLHPSFLQVVLAGASVAVLDIAVMGQEYRADVDPGLVRYLLHLGCVVGGDFSCSGVVGLEQNVPSHELNRPHGPVVSLHGVPDVEEEIQWDRGIYSLTAYPAFLPHVIHLLSVYRVCDGCVRVALVLHFKSGLAHHVPLVNQLILRQNARF